MAPDQRSFSESVACCPLHSPTNGLYLSANVGNEVIITSTVWEHNNKHIYFSLGHGVKGKELTQQAFLVRHLCGQSDRL